MGGGSGELVGHLRRRKRLPPAEQGEDFVFVDLLFGKTWLLSRPR